MDFYFMEYTARQLNLSTVAVFLLAIFWLCLEGKAQEENLKDPDTLLTATDTMAAQLQNDSISEITDSDTNKTYSSKLVKDTIEYEADIIEYDIKSKIILMKSNGIVRYKDMTLYADTIHFLFAEDVLLATGHPQLIEGNDTVVGENMVYDLNTRRGKVRYGTAHSEDSKYSGLQIARSDDESFYIEEGAYTSCAVVDSPHYCFYGRHIKVTPKDKAISRPVILNIGDAPVAVLPYFITPLEKGRQSGWLRPKWGGNPTHGGYLENIGYYWAPNDYTDLTVTSKVTEFETYVLRARSNYALRYWLTGGLSWRHTLSTSYDTLNNEWALNYSHNQNLLPDESMRLSGSGNIVSGKSFYRSFSEDTTELLNQKVDANLSLTKSFSKINGYGNLDWRRTHNFKTNSVDQDLPSFSFKLNTRPLLPYKKENNNSASDDDNEKWYNKINYGYSILGKQKYIETSKNEEDENTRRHAGINHNLRLSASQKIFKWFNLSPSFNINQSVVDAYIDTFKIYDTIYTPRDTIVPIISIIDTSITEIDTVFINDTLKLKYQAGIDTTINTIQDTTYIWQDNFSWRKAHNYWWDAGASLSTTMYGIFPIKIFNFTGLRHTLSPSISYTFTPKRNIDITYPNVVPFVKPKEKRSQVIGLGIGNTFQGKVESKKNDDSEETKDRTFTMFTANISTSYDFEKATKKWSNISLSGTIPSKFISMSFNSSFSPYNEKDKLIFPKILSYGIRFTPATAGASGSFWGGDFLIFEGLQPEDYMIGYNDLSTPGWKISLRPSYNFSKSRPTVTDDFTIKKDYHLSTSASIRFTHIWSTSWSSKYDFVTNKFANHSMNFLCNLECWALHFDWYPSGFNRGSFCFVVKIKKHPEIKWERRPGSI